MKQTFLSFLFLLLPIVASADDSGKCGQNLTYSYIESTHTLTIRGTGDMAVRGMDSTWGYYPWHDYRNEIQHVIIEMGVTSISQYSFSECKNLTSIEIPNTVESMGHHSFSHCINLTAIIIPSAVTRLNNGTFFNCQKLNSITIPTSVHTIDDNVFVQCSSFKSITIPSSVTKIGAGVFNYCNLENVIVRDINLNILDYTGKNKKVFSDRTFQHAILYVPIGMKWEAVYGSGGWYMFNNIREIAMEENDISTSRAYLMMNIKDNKIMVYDAVNNQVVSVNTSFNIDESNPANSWQIVNQDGKSFLYNIGARKYASVSANGEFKLSSTPVAVRMNESENGFILGENPNDQWGFVLNDNVRADASITGIVDVEAKRDKSKYHSLDGHSINQPKKGVFVMDGKKIFIK